MSECQPRDYQIPDLIQKDDSYLHSTLMMIVVSLCFFKFIMPCFFSVLTIMVMTSLYCSLDLKISELINNLLFSSEFFGKVPVFTRQWGYVQSFIFILFLLLTPLHVTPSTSFFVTSLNCYYISILVFLFASAVKCFLIGFDTVSLNATRKGFWGIFQRVFILIRSLIIWTYWNVYFFETKFISIYTIFSSEYSYLPRLFLLLKTLKVLWLVYNMIQTIISYNANDSVTLKFVVNTEPNFRCPVCFNDDPPEVIQTNCRHCVCYECAFKWISINPSCPLCTEKIAPIVLIELSDATIPPAALLLPF